MPINILGKLLFPDLQRWQRRQRLWRLGLAVFFGLLTAGAVAGFIYWQYMSERH